VEDFNGTLWLNTLLIAIAIFLYLSYAKLQNLTEIQLISVIIYKGWVNFIDNLKFTEYPPYKKTSPLLPNKEYNCEGKTDPEEDFVTRTPIEWQLTIYELKFLTYFEIRMFSCWLRRVTMELLIRA